jgi:hypothetical protein
MHAARSTHHAPPAMHEMASRVTSDDTPAHPPPPRCERPPATLRTPPASSPPDCPPAHVAMLAPSRCAQRAIFWGRTSVCRLLLATSACDLHRRNHAAESPAYLAALRGHSDCLALLLAADEAAGSAPGCNGEHARRAASRDYHDGYSPLHAAVISRSLPCIELLLAAGFSPSAQNKYGQTPLHIAASLGGLPPQGVERLLAAGCDVSLRDERGHTAERVASLKGHEHVVRLLAAASQTAVHAAAPPPSAASLPRQHRHHEGGAGEGTPRSDGPTNDEADSDRPSTAPKGGRGSRRRRGRGAAAARRQE